jgi:hypothetical protein
LNYANPQLSNNAAIRRSFEKAGVIFEGNGFGGVKLKIQRRKFDRVRHRTGRHVEPHRPAPEANQENGKPYWERFLAK